MFYGNYTEMQLKEAIIWGEICIKNAKAALSNATTNWL